MGSGEVLVARESGAYREFVRLYRIARSLRPTSVDRWNGDLYATYSDVWGSVSPRTGAIRLSGVHVLPYLTGVTSHTHPGEQAEALATVLHEATHTGMDLKGPSSPANAVYSEHSAGLTEGIAELRAIVDFESFAERAGYDQLVLPKPHYAGAYTASASLLDQAAGPRVDRKTLLSRLISGPAVMHFDALADGVVRNRLWDVVPHHSDHQGAARAALIPAMAHEMWPGLHKERSTTGHWVAEQVRQDLNAKVDEIRRHYSRWPHETFSDGSVDRRLGGGVAPVRPAQRHEAAAQLRFLDGVAPAGGATRFKPLVGDGSRRPGVSLKGGRRTPER